MPSVFDIDFEHILTDCQSNKKMYNAKILGRVHNSFKRSVSPQFISIVFIQDFKCDGKLGHIDHMHVLFVILIESLKMWYSAVF